MRGHIVLVLSLEWLARFGDPACPLQTDACPGDLVLASAIGDDVRLRWHHGPGLPGTVIRGVAAESDSHARGALQAAGCSPGLLPDAGDPARLWALASELGHAPWLGDEASPAVRAEVALAVARATGAAHPSVDTPALRALRAAARIAMGGQTVDGDLARAAGLWPHLLLRPDGIPSCMPEARRQGLPEDADRIFRQAAERLRADPPPGLRPGPPPRPVLLSMPKAGDQQDAEEVSQHAPLAGQVAMVPAPDARAVRTALEARFPWMQEAVGLVAQELALLPEGAPCVIPPLLLAGPPGCGKTTFARELAAACGLPSRLVHTADGNGATTLAGNGRGWRSGRPALPITVMLEAGISTVAVVVDDIDRQGTDSRYGTPQEWLLGVTEPSTAGCFQDPFLQVRCDLTTVSWMMTANDVSGAVGALLDRVAVIEVGYPPPAAAEVVLASVVRDLEAAAGWAPGSMKLPPGVRDLLLSSFAADTSTLRLLRRAVRAAVGAARLGEDGLVAARRELGRARRRDDRGYMGGSGIGFARTAQGWS